MKQKFDINSCGKGEVSTVRVVEHCTGITKVRVEILFKHEYKRLKQF